MKNKRTFGYIEVAFDIIYLTAMLVLGVVLLINNPTTLHKIFGIMAVICFLGDSFHLLPRIASAIKKDAVYSEQLLGFGKMNASITMTVFYVLLWHGGLLLFNIDSMAIYTNAIYLLALIRIVFCLLPQNHWSTGDPSNLWNAMRNIPFILMGAMVCVLFFINRNVHMDFRFMWLAVLLSFACYLPVVFLAKKHPPIGMLMLPKSCMYLWIIAMAVAFR